MLAMALMIWDPDHADRPTPAIVAKRDGRCDVCREPIFVGEDLIEKAEDGRWSHALCLRRREEIAATVAAEEARS